MRDVTGAVATGAASGFMDSAAGVGGPAVSLDAVNTGWTVREFVPSAVASPAGERRTASSADVWGRRAPPEELWRSP
ncbi:hypothetical protein [Streptosporangium sp. NPDC002524]|uniref:hypothetical protein n=1 Tax=Streptosporangium sp. NPDC002524 TaxID=3154537 RepID=UPI0033224692